MANPPQKRYAEHAEFLLDRIRGDKYPSGTQMDMFESIAPMRLRVEYVMFLLEKIEDDPNPSIPMMRRVHGLISEFGS